MTPVPIPSRWRSGLLLLLAAATLPVAAWGADPFKGKELYVRHCQRCHGEKGDAKFAGVPNLNWRSGSASGLLKPDKEILLRILTGKNACPSYRGIISDREILDIIAHMRVAYQ